MRRSGIFCRTWRMSGAFIVGISRAASGLLGNGEFIRLSVGWPSGFHSRQKESRIPKTPLNVSCGFAYGVNWVRALWLSVTFEKWAKNSRYSFGA